jgi:tRNA-dihydrouridine synthase B
LRLLYLSFNSSKILNMLKIGSLKIENGLVLAPMAGYTNLGFRLTIKKLGAGLVTTEMVSAMGLTLNHGKTLGYLKSHADEKPLAVQIFGSEPVVMARASEIAAQHGADLIDINMGCPVKKVVKTGAGASLLKDKSKIEEILQAVRKSCHLPLTVKIRTGWSPLDPVACEVAHIAEDCGADGITIHPRFATQGFSVPADWSWIRKVKEAVKIPVIGNGDVFDAPAALRMKTETGCDGVMIGRGAVRNPWIFRQTQNLEQGLPFSEPRLDDRKSFVMDHYRFLCESMSEQKAALTMRGILISFTKGLPNSSRLRGSISRIVNKETLYAITSEYFSEPKSRVS